MGAEKLTSEERRGRRRAGGGEVEMTTAGVRDVAQYILERMSTAGEKALTTWKLQKLVYYAQSWAVVWDEEPLFNERIEAWANGPVCPALYSIHRGKFKVTKFDIPNADSAVLNEEQKQTIDAVLDHYGRRTGRYLSALTHQEPPWKEAREGLSVGERGDREITLEAMGEYYGGLVQTEEGPPAGD